MPKRIIKFDLDINKKDNAIKFNVKDYEDLEIHTSLLDNGQPYDLTGFTVDFIPSNGKKAIVRVNGNTVIFTYNSGYLYNQLFEGEFVISNKDGVVKTPSFNFYVSKSLSKEVIVAVNLVDREGYTLKDSTGSILTAREMYKQLTSTGEEIDLTVNKLKTVSSVAEKNHNHSYNDLTNKPTIPTMTSQLTNNSKFTDETWVVNKIAEASLGGGEVDLSGYVTTIKHSEDLNLKVDKVSGKGLSTNDFTTTEKNKLSGLNNYTHPSTHNASIITEDSTHRFVTDTEKSTWNNKSNFDGNYNSLTNKPSIPTVDVTKAYVDTELGKKADSSHNHTEYSSTSHTHSGYNHDSNYAPKNETIVSKTVSGSILQLSTDKYQKCTTISNGTEIKLPTSVSGLMEIHLYLNPTSDISLTLPSCKWQNTPSFKANKSYELIFTYNSINWLGGCIEYV